MHNGRSARHHAIGCGVWLACLAACADASESAPAEPEYPPASEYCERITSFFCDFYLRCGRMAVADRATCRAVMAESCEGRYEPRYVALEEAGLLQLSRVGLSACEEHLSQVACDAQLKDLDGPCRAMWEGRQSPGGACGWDVDYFVCGSEQTCVLDLSFCGTCEPAAAPGDSCAGDVYCEDGATCRDDVCVRRRTAGESCSGGEPCALGTSCNGVACEGPEWVGVDDACGADRRCPYLSRCIDGFCRATARLGEACDDDTPCETGWCDPSAECRGLREAGAECELGAQCASGRCGDSGCERFATDCVGSDPDN